MEGISGLGLSSYYSPYSSVYATRSAQRSNNAQASGSTHTVAAIPAAQTGTPVQPVQPVKAPPAVELDQADMLKRLDSDPAANAARSRIQYTGERPGTIPVGEQTVQQAAVNGPEDTQLPGTVQTQQAPGSYNAQRAVGDMELPGTGDPDAAFNIPGAVPTPYDTDFPGADGEKAGFPQLPGAPKGDEGDQVDGTGSKSAQEVAEEGECQTCKNRKYQDGSDDPGVSFKTPAHISPDEAASVVRGHEMEHVTRNQAKAQREGREVVSQSVSYHTAICPECGRVYVSGGTTQTVTAGSSDSGDSAGKVEASEKSGGAGKE